VKFTPRAAIAALITATAALLATQLPAQASPVPPTPNPVLFGTWTNINPLTNSIKAIVIRPGKTGIAIEGFGACVPSACEWGIIPGTVFGPNVSSPTGATFEANQDFGFSREVLLGTAARSPFTGFRTLTVREFTTFTDNSGRANYEVTETFVPGNLIIPAKTGVPTIGYPLGDWVKPASTLLGTWFSTSPTAGIRKIIITENLNGTLAVRAFGNCTPTLCAWGKVTAVTFGTSILSTTGQTFLAPYSFGFANKLLDGTVNFFGTRLVVHTYTEFLDHSGRSNYLLTDTFTRG